MTPAEQLDIIRSCEVVESVDEGEVSKRDLEVTHRFLIGYTINKTNKCLKPALEAYNSVLTVRHDFWKEEFGKMFQDNLHSEQAAWLYS